MDLSFDPRVGPLIDRRSALLSAAGAIAFSRFSSALAQPSMPPDRYLWLEAKILPTASLPSFVRLFKKGYVAGPQSHYLEFSKKSAFAATQSPAPNNQADYFLPLSSNIYLSDDPVPTPASASAADLATVSSFHQSSRSGLVMMDGSSVTVIPGSAGIPSGLRGPSGSSSKSISVTTYAAQLPGRQPGKLVPWALSSAVVSQAGEPDLTMTYGVSPEAFLATLGISYGNVRTSLLLDFAGVGDNAGAFMITRDLSYYGDLFSHQTIRVTASAAQLGMPLAVSAVWRPIARVSAFAPALESITPTAPSTGPLTTLATLDPGFSETRQDYIRRGALTLSPVLVPLVQTLCDRTRPGMQALARWMADVLIVEQSAIQTSLGATWDDYQAFKRSAQPSASFRPQPTVKNNGDELTDQIWDWLGDHKPK